MRRREFIAGLGGAAAWPVLAQGQQPPVMLRVGVLVGGAQDDPERTAPLAEFTKALRDFGWVDGRNVRLDWRWAAGDAGRARNYAAELIALKPEVLFGDNTFVVRELQQATRSLPIVFARVNNPIGSGFVSSLARPGQNITGFADTEPPSMDKLAEFLKEVAPQVTHVGVISSGSGDSPESGVPRVANAAASLGLRVHLIQVHDPRTIEDAIVAFSQEPHGGLILPAEPLTTIHRKLIVALAAAHKMPAAYGHRFYVLDGGLLSYGTDRNQQYRGAAGYIDRILRGAKPTDLPVQQPNKFELVINLKTAKALGLEIPPTLLAIADEVIE
jgi:putative tryptophan/tyrosine transport system substrate-binding protein